MSKAKWFLVAILPVIIFGLIIYAWLFINPTIVIIGRVSMEHTSYCIDENVDIAFCVIGEDGFKYFLTYENWSLVKTYDYYQWYGKNVMVEGHIKEVSILGEKAYLLALTSIQV